MRRGEALRAAGEFDAMLDSGKLDAARRADVLYWSAQAYSRAGKSATAESRARRLVSEFANSFRAADAALMLGEMTLARGERAEARQWFRRAAGSTHPSVRARAEKGLSELGPER
jgi:TolA-binding protein